MCQVVVEAKNQYLLVSLSGQLVLNCSSELKEKVKEAANEHQQYHLIVDLSQVDFIDSSGLGVLIAWFKHVNEAQGKVIYTNVTEYVYKIIRLAKLDKIFTITDSVNDAISLI